MTCRQKLMIEHPECVGDEFEVGCCGCPSHYGYLPDPNPKGCENEDCHECWDREIPGTPPVFVGCLDTDPYHNNDIPNSFEYLSDMGKQRIFVTILERFKHYYTGELMFRVRESSSDGWVCERFYNETTVMDWLKKRVEEA